MHRILHRARPAAVAVAAGATMLAVVEPPDFLAAPQQQWRSGRRGRQQQQQQQQHPVAMCSGGQRVVGKLLQLGGGGGSGGSGAPVKLADALERLAGKQLVIIGEVHGASAVVDLQAKVQACMIGDSSTRLNVVLEHFSFEMQHLLDQYGAGTMSLETMCAEYHKIGTESHDIQRYAALLEFAREHADQIKLHAGFIPRTYARQVMRGQLDTVLAEAKAKGYIGPEERCVGSEGHYSMFESLISGRDLHNPDGPPPSEQFRKMFPAQVLKDCSMAHKVNRLLAGSATHPQGRPGLISRPSDEKFLIIVGAGHMGYEYGVPERIFSAHPWLRARSCSIYARPADHLLSLEQKDSGDQTATLAAVFGAGRPAGGGEEGAAAAGRPAAADLCFLFDEEYEGLADGADRELANVKDETRAAYDKVGQTASRVRPPAQTHPCTHTHTHRSLLPRHRRSPGTSGWPTRS